MINVFIVQDEWINTVQTNFYKKRKLENNICAFNKK